MKLLNGEVLTHKMNIIFFQYNIYHFLTTVHWIPSVLQRPLWLVGLSAGGEAEERMAGITAGTRE